MQLLFITGLFFFLLSFGAYFLEKEKFAISFLILSSGFIFLYAGTLYPFLNVWDERFHALVSKNLMHHPLMPTLYDEKVITTDYEMDWAHYHIWLHKQPLFMWQIALSFKLFGVNEVALRLPTIILSCLMVYGAYRTGKLLGNWRIGFNSAALTVSSIYLLKLISGRQAVDQNDVSFLAYVSLSLWAFTEYVYSGKYYWLILIGIFSGFAILCKWLAGMLVYLAWGVYSLIKHRLRIRKYWDISLAFAITVAIALPWQVLTLIWYPSEARSALELNGRHFTEAVDGQEGPATYHLELMGQLFGSWVPYLIIPAVIIFYLRSSDKKLSISLIIALVFLYVVFSLAATKMPSFTIIAMIPIFLSLSFLSEETILILVKTKVPAKLVSLIFTISLAIICFVRLDIRSLYSSRAFTGIDDSYYRTALSHNKEVFQKLNLPANAVLFNVTGKHFVEAMFYTGLPAYSFVPSLSQCEEAKAKGRVIAIFRPQSDSIPEYLQNDKHIILITDTIRQCE